MGIYIIPQSNGFLSLSGGTVTGNTLFLNNLTGITYFSGSTNLEEIIYNISYLNSGRTYTFSAGTNLNLLTANTNPNVTYRLSDNVSVNSLYSNLFSGNTIYSGSTDLSLLFTSIGHTHYLYQILNTAHTHSISDIINLQDVLNTKQDISGLTQTFVQPGTNTYTGGTNLNPTVNVSALTINTLNASGNSIFLGTLSGGSSFSANTLFSGTSNLNTLFVTPGQLSASQTNVQNGTNTYTGGTALNPTINVSALTINTLNASGNTFLSSTTASTMTVGSLSGGGTLMVITDNNGFLSTQSIPVAGQSTIIRNGLNTYTAGTTTDYTINISALTINTLTASGNSVFSGTLSGGSSFSANTLFSGTSNLNTLFSSTGHTHQFSTILNTAHTHSISDVDNLQGSLNTKLNLSGGTMTGQLTTNSLSATTLSGGSIFSGTSNLQTIITSLIPSQLLSGTTLGGIKQIYPGDTNVANENYSISFGSNNKVYNKYSTILNGKTNIINSNVGNFYYNTILGGKNQTTYNSKYSLIGFGAGNYMGGYYSVILGGSGNRIYNVPEHSFLLGTNNKTESSRSFIFGYTNLITGVTNSSILGGRNNKIHKIDGNNHAYNIVLNSIQATILNSDFSNLASGSGNTISSGNFSSIINGQSNKTYSLFSTVINGRFNTAKTEYSIVLGGSGNTAFGISSIILGGFNNRNTTLSSSYSTIINGLGNVISTCPIGFGSDKTTKFGTVINGFGNHVMYNFASVFNGNANHANGLYNLVGNGKYNTTNINHEAQTATTVLNGAYNSAKHNYATIINGLNNKVETFFGFIGNGNYNQVPSQGHYGTILNGKQNNVQGGYFNQILNGDYNLIAGVNIRHNTIINGSRNKIPNNLSGVTILGGIGLTATTSNTALGDYAQFRSLTGLTTQMVVADNNGLLSVQSIPTGGSGGSTINNGINTFTAGTSSFQSVNITALTINTLTASGNSVFSGTLSGGSSFSANTLFSGTSNLNTLFSSTGHTHQFSTILNTAHTHSISEIDNLQGSLNTKLNLSGGTMTGQLITASLSATTLSGGSIFSGTSNLNTLFVTPGQLSASQTFVQSGINTYTGGTALNPTINVSALTINTLTASGNSIFSGTLSGGSSFSASTLHSGSTNLNSIFSQIGHTHQFSAILNTAHTHSISEVDNLQGSLNTKLNLSGGTMTGQLTTTSLFATTLSGGSIFSGTTDLYNIFATSGGSGESNTASNLGLGIGIFESKSGVDLRFKSLSAGSNTTITSDSTTIVISSNGGSGTSTNIQPGINTYTGGTALNPTVNVSALTIDTLTTSGNSVFSGTLSGGSSFSANTLFSGTSNLNTIFSQTGHTHVGGIGFTIDAGISVITTGYKGCVIVPFNAIIQSWTIVADTTGSIVVDVWKDNYGNYPPVSGDTITGTEKITLSNQQKNQDLTLTSWNTTLSSGDILSFKVDSSSLVKKVYVMINVIKLN